MAFDRKNSNNVMKAGERTTSKSRRISRSTKRTKKSGPVFGMSSQFRGIGRGVPGDVRK